MATRGKHYVFTDKDIERVYQLARSGLIKSELIKFLPFSEVTWYNYQRLWTQHQDSSEEEIQALPNRDRKAIEMIQAFHDGHQTYLDTELNHFSKSTDTRIRWRLFERAVKAYQLKKGVDMEDLDLQLRREFGDKKTEAILDILLSETFDFEVDNNEKK